MIGVGSAPFDFLTEARQQVIGVNVAEKSTARDKSGRLSFRNLRSQLWWRMREALDPANNTGIALPPDSRLLADLCAPTWKLSGAEIYVASREEIVAKIGRSPDYASAYCLALLDTPKIDSLRAVGGERENVLRYRRLSGKRHGAARLMWPGMPSRAAVLKAYLRGVAAVRMWFIYGN